MTSSALWLLWTAGTKANPAALTNALAEGWAPSQQHCGGEASEILQAMSWMGRKSAEKLAQHLKANLDGGLIESWNCVLKKLMETLQIWPFRKKMLNEFTLYSRGTDTRESQYYNP